MKAVFSSIVVPHNGYHLLCMVVVICIILESEYMDLKKVMVWAETAGS